jgi:RHS repeat-associated protein
MEIVVSYAYDFADRLLGVRQAFTSTLDGIAQTRVEAVSYTYDGLSRESGKQVESSAMGYVYDGRSLIEVRDAVDGRVATIVPGLQMDRDGSTLYYHTDGLGSVRALADDTGRVVKRMRYVPFGGPVYERGDDSVDPVYVFRGRRYDADSGLYVHGPHRYDPQTGRYVQRGDPRLGNAYTFADDNPARGLPRLD